MLTSNSAINSDLYFIYRMLFLALKVKLFKSVTYEVLWWLRCLILCLPKRGHCHICVVTHYNSLRLSTLDVSQQTFQIHLSCYSMFSGKPCTVFVSPSPPLVNTPGPVCWATSSVDSFTKYNSLDIHLMHGSARIWSWHGVINAIH